MNIHVHCTGDMTAMLKSRNLKKSHDEHTGDMTAMLKSRNLKKSQPTGLSPRIHVSIQSRSTIGSNFIASQPVSMPT